MNAPSTVARIVVPEGAPRELWLAERGEGVTASEVYAIARGGIRTWRRILEGKLNGNKFHGNAATRAGQSREAALLDEAAEHLAEVTPNGALWAAAENDLHRATPDGFGVDANGDLCVIEVKSHEHGWDSEEIPAEHMAQMQFQAYVRGARGALYGFEVRDEDDMPPIDGATWLWVERDEEMIEWLISRANAFIAWRDAGCPDVDDLPDAVAIALDEWAIAKKQLVEAEPVEKKTNAAMKQAVKILPYAERFGAVGMGPKGGFQLTVAESVSIDEDAWKKAEPEEHARVEQMRVALAFAEATAKKRFPKITRRSTLRFQEVEADV